MKEKNNQLQTLARKKKAYQTPKVLSTETLEVLAALCTGPGAKGDLLSCPIGPIQS